jgi:hypothetical protein
MKIIRSRGAGALAAAAALSLTATPALARGWHRHHDGIDGGDVFAGLLVLGGVAAIAAAASKSSKERRARDDDRYRDDPDYRDDGYRDAPPPRAYDDRDYRDYRGDPGRSPGLSADGAIDACVGAVAGGERSVDGVDSVHRDGDGWRVAGRDRDGREFACSIDREGRIRGLAGA